MSWYLRAGHRAFAAAAGRIRVPTLVVWGTRDRLVDVRLSRRAAAAYPHSRLLVIAGCGHVPQLEEPETTARAMLARWRDAAAADSGTSGLDDEDQAGRAVAVHASACGNLVA
jgi:pimeloyl-ACP methyl ester carboxylesterase